MRLGRPLAALSLLIWLPIFIQAVPSSASIPARQVSVAAVSECTEAANCVFLPWMRVPAPPPPFEPLRTLPGAASAVAVDGGHAYVGQLNALSIVDLSDPRRPELIGKHTFSDPRGRRIQDIEPRPPLAYASTFQRYTSCCMLTELHLFDVSQLASPRVITSTITNGSDDIDVVDQRIYSVGQRWLYSMSDLAIYDHVAPSRLRRRGSYNENGYGSAAVALKGTIAYIADYQNGIQVLDVSNPENPALLATIPTTSNANDAQIDGEYLYVALDGGLAIFDISVPQAPVLRALRQTPGPAWDLIVAAGRAYVGMGEQGVAILDLRRPDDLELLATYQTAGLLRDLEVDGSLLYLATDNGLEILRVVFP